MTASGRGPVLELQGSDYFTAWLVFWIFTGVVGVAATIASAFVTALVLSGSRHSFAEVAGIALLVASLVNIPISYLFYCYSVRRHILRKLNEISRLAASIQSVTPTAQAVDATMDSESMMPQ